MRLETSRLLIRESVLADWPAYRRIWSDFATSPYAQYDAPFETDAVKGPALLRTLLAGGRFFSVLLRESGEMIGYVCFHGEGETLDLGYCFHSASQGMGYAREACQALMAAMARQGAARFTAGTALDNLPSVRLLRALGFRQTGVEQVSFYRDARGGKIWFTGGIFERAAGEGQ